MTAIAWGLMPALPPADVGLALELERIRRLMTAGTIDMETAGWLAERAHDALEAELERREAPRAIKACNRCRGTGTRPHAPGCTARELL